MIKKIIDYYKNLNPIAKEGLKAILALIGFGMFIAFIIYGLITLISRLLCLLI